MLPATEIIRYSDHIESSGSEVYRQACLLAAEGIVSKQAAGIYEQKRSRSWLKTKCLHRQEMVVGGWTEPGGSRPGFGALLLGYYDNKNLVYAGRVGSGFKQNMLRQLSSLISKLEQNDPPFRNPPSGADARGVHWVKPELVAEVRIPGMDQGKFVAAGLLQRTARGQITPAKSSGNRRSRMTAAESCPGQQDRRHRWAGNAPPMR